MNSNGLYHTIREQIADRLRREVLAGELCEGEPLREQQLAERFGVSRGPIRDALLQLTQEGLLASQPNRGVKVGGKPSESLRPLILQLRRDIERFALETVFDQITPEDMQYWEELLARLRTACEEGDMPALVEHDMAFHRSFIEKADPELVSVWLPIVLRMRLVYSRHDDHLDCYVEHAAVLEAIRAGDQQAAVEALTSNIQ
ncbi:MAG: GntR family transcriptional regulator [Planctomycetales bacterium]